MKTPSHSIRNVVAGVVMAGGLAFLSSDVGASCYVQTNCGLACGCPGEGECSLWTNADGTQIAYCMCEGWRHVCDCEFGCS
jgi:hypothetical protein